MDIILKSSIKVLIKRDGFVGRVLFVCWGFFWFQVFVFIFLKVFKSVAVAGT